MKTSLLIVGVAVTNIIGHTYSEGNVFSLTSLLKMDKVVIM